MKRRIVSCLSVLYLLCTVSISAQNSNTLILNDFPASWQGDWAGELQIFTSEGLKQSLPMQLLIQPIENSTDYSFSIIYGVDVEAGLRSYVLKTIDASKGLFAIDEQNSIMIDAYFLGETLVQRFEVMGNLLETIIEKRGDTLEWKIFSGSIKPSNTTGDTVYEGDTIPPVKTFPMKVLQKCIMSKID